jgi:Protein of unknown function (DUF2470)
MQPASSPPTPVAAERVRTVLATTSGAALTCLDGHDTSVQVETHEHDGRLLLRPINPDTLDPRAHSMRAPRQATVEIADVAPIPLGDRIRARIHIEGSLIQDETTTGVLWHYLPEEVRLLENGDSQTVPLSAVLRARPDPCAQVEGALLTHWDSAHPEALALMARLVPHEQLLGVVGVKPLRLDRHGLVLRLGYARGHRDTRVHFPTPVSTPNALPLAMHALLQQARRRRRPCRGWSSRRPA